ncbi:flavin-containing amine oxidase [Penicillium frequentans]|nr:flavin-containing amine oxidase [Penicillium glabrum]
MDSNSVTRESVDVVVIGAGLSGLRAALIIQAAGFSCTVVEATDRVGGKTLTLPSKKNGPGVNDLGAAWINDTTQSEMFKLVQHYGIQTEIQMDRGNDVWVHDDEVTLSPHGVLPVSFSVVYYHPMKTRSLALTSNRWWYGYNRIHGGQYLRVRQGKEQEHPGLSDLSMELISEGTQTISQNMAEELKAGSLWLSTPATHIEQCSETGVCRVHSAHESVFSAKKVILSVATPLYSTIKFSPPLPAEKQHLSQGNFLGYYSKVIFVFENSWWRTAGFSGEMKAQDQGPILFSVDTSIPDDDQWSISCFIVGGRGVEWSKLSQKERYSSAWNQLRSAFENVDLDSGRIEVPQPINTLEFEWTKQDFFHGGPCPASPPGLLLSVDGDALRKPFQNIHFVGTETSLEWKGYMEGAIRSGNRGGAEVIEKLQFKH